MKHLQKIESVLASLAPRDRVVALEVAQARALLVAVEADDALREKLNEGADLDHEN